VKPKRQKTKAEVTAPVDAKVWSQAKAIAAGYTLIVQPEAETGYVGRTLEMPAVMADGPTPKACIEAVLEGTALAVATFLEAGERPPARASDHKRTAQVNVRLTQAEKFQIEEAAKRSGYRGVSDFVRSAALDQAG
jgi:predicted RNase H-like HicB family nuclease